jgi:site-specific DNA recombinase
MSNRIAPPTVLATPGGPTLVKGAQLMKSVPQTPKRAVLYARVSTEAQAADDKTSLPEQLLALRRYADANGYRVVEEISEEITGRKQDTEGLERIRDLADDEQIDAVLVYKWNRMARTVARFESFMLEMRLARVEVVSLDGQSNETASGRMFNRLMAVFNEYQRDDLVATMQQGKRGQARRGKMVPGRYAPFGFEYDRETRSYTVNESRMIHVRRMFRMVAEEGSSLRGIKRAFEADAIPTVGGGRRWHPSTVRDMILNDVYLPHSRAELADLVARGNLAPELLSTLDSERSYGIQWYSKNKWETDGEGHRIVTERPRDEWIAIPTPDAGVPREHVDAAREAIKDNVRPSNAGHRAWPLKGIAYCPCGTRLKPHRVNKKNGPHFYYVCYTHRSDAEPCPYGKYIPAAELEKRVAAFVLGLLRNPETLRAQIEAEAEREKATIRDSRKKLAALARELSEAEAERERLVRLYTRGKITDDEYDAHSAEMEKRKELIESEAARLEDERRYVEYLDELPRLIEDYLAELPKLTDELPRIREHVLDENRTPVYALYDEETGERIGTTTTRPAGKLAPELVVPGMHRKRPPEEIRALESEALDERARRYRTLYDRLDLHVVADPGGDLEISWIGGVRKVSGGAWSA